MTDNIISMTKINKFYDDFHVLKNIDFSVKKGEIVVVCGPSGSGKSTLIRCINGLEDIDDGDIIVDNIDIHASKKNLQAIRSEVGMVFQHFNLFPHLTILENITIAPTLVKNMNKKEVKQIAMDLLEKVKLADKANSYPADLSGGQKQRVAISRALINNPDIILADEPTGALDSKSSKMLLEGLKKLNNNYNSTILMVTHDAFSASYASRVIFIKDGKLFNEFERGNSSRKEFFEKIIDVVSILGGDISDVI